MFQMKKVDLDLLVNLVTSLESDDEQIVIGLESRF